VVRLAGLRFAFNRLTSAFAGSFVDRLPGVSVKSQHSSGGRGALVGQTHALPLKV
jgi:hypothetical protein